MIQKKKLFIYFIFVSNTVYLHSGIELAGKIGPAFTMFNMLLLPSKDPSSSLLSVANDNSSWNLMTWMAGEGKYTVGKHCYAMLELAGGTMRHGRAIVTDSSQLTTLGLIVGSAVDQYTSVFLNAFDCNGWVGCGYPVNEHISVGCFAGYHFSKEFEKLSFIESPLIFFTRSRYKGPFIGAAVKTKVKECSFSLKYKLIIGTVHARLTENLSNTTVLRKVPRVFSNAFAFGCSYELKENITLGGDLIYSNAHNHKLGTSKTYMNGVLTHDVKNVLNALVRSIKCLLSVSAEF